MAISTGQIKEKDLQAACVCCQTEFPLSNFKVLSEGPPKRLLDFCDECVREFGIPKLYERYAGQVNEDVARVVRREFAQEFARVLPSTPAPASPGAQAPKKLTADEARKEFASREIAARMFMPFVLRFFPTYKAGWVHHDIARRLEKFVEAVERQESPRLILTMPPRHGKSTLVSDMFPAWVLGRHPEWEIISASYAVSLPLGFSRNIRDRLRDPAYQTVFENTTMREDAMGIEQWKLTGGGGYRASGVGGGITGMGAHILIVDDPLKDAAEAQSDRIREGVKSWFNTAAYNRLAPGGGILLVQTRWHDDDLAGSCMTQMKEQIEGGVETTEIDLWELVNYPAIATQDEWLHPDGSINNFEVGGARLLRREGDPLHPERYDITKLRRIKNRYTPSEWSALYQQDPVPDDGAFFSRDMMRFFPFLPGSRKEYTFLTAWDVAIGEKRRNDWTVGVVVAVNERNELFLVEMVRGRFGTMELVRSAVDLIVKYDCAVFGMEHGPIKMTLWPLILDEMRRQNVQCTINDDLRPVQEKETRATPLRGLMQQGRVYFPMPSTTPWVERVIGEMLRFPAGTHDDIVDALAWAARMARTAPKPEISAMLQENAPVSWRDELHSWPGVTITA